MQLTLWQQFSSNHSAAYTVVGMFPTPSAAQDAYTKLREIIQSIADDKGGSQNELYMTAAEIRIAEQYNIDWQERLDWLHAMELPPNHSRNPPYTVDDAVQFYDNLVFVIAPITDTWQTGHQFAALMRAMDGEAFQDAFMGWAPEDNGSSVTDVSFSIDCDAPETETALEIAFLLNQRLTVDWNVEEEHNRRDAMPWAIYHPRASKIMPDVSPTQYAELEREYLADKHAENRPLAKLREETNMYDGLCEQAGQHLHIQGYNRLTTGLPALLEWLKARGCVNIVNRLKEDERKYPGWKKSL